MSSKFVCRFCKEQFDVPKGLYKHLQSAHTAGGSKDNRTCPICGVLCLKYEAYRDHLLYIHGQSDEGLKLTFKSLNEFLVWKAELELKHNCKYVLQSSPKVLPSKEKKYFYQCDRANSKDKKDKKASSVVMKTCTSVISVVEGINVFKVEYWDTHVGHSTTPPAQSLQNELEAAINSVEMVNAIADIDASCDRSEDMLVTENSSPVSNVEKHSLFMKSKSSDFTNNSSYVKKVNTKPSPKIEGSKKKNSNTILFSLASVACGKGIKKKIPVETCENKDSTKASSEHPKNTVDLIEENSLNIPELQKGDSALQISVTAAPLNNSTVLSSTVATTTTTSLSSTTKAVPSGLPVIAPKVTSACTTISSASYATINSLINSNSAFSNQLVIVNPVGLDQNSLNSKQLTSGQNILFSLGSAGQSTAPGASQSVNVVSVGEKNPPNTTKKDKHASSKTTGSSTVQNTSKTGINSVASTTSNTTPVSLKSGMNNTPVILSSLPIGSTFMSVNNNLIPIATPSGTFLPTSLPPNIVLTPVVPSTSLSSTNSIQKTSVTNTVNTTMSNIQSQIRYTPITTVSITVSSIVKEPVYSSTSAVKQVSQIVASSMLPISSASALKTYSKSHTKSASSTLSEKTSPLRKVNYNKFMSKTSVKSILKEPLSKTNSSEITSGSTKKVTDNVPSAKGNIVISNFSTMPTVTVSSITSPKSRTSARKRITSIRPKPQKNSVDNTSSMSVLSSSSNTKVVNSQLNLAPISSATITSQPMDVDESGTLLFESSGDVYMLEPVESGTVPMKQTTGVEFSKKQIDKSIQTIENSCSKPKIQRKRTAVINEDSAVMIKVKCYQLEMKYLNILGECKRLKVELTKEKLKNAELAGEKSSNITEENMAPDTSKSKASEIMKEIEENFAEKSDLNIYTMTKTSVLRNLYEDLEDLCMENTELNKELEKYRAHDKFYKSLKKKLYDEEF